MNHIELRNKFLNFFKNKGHKKINSSPVIPYDDPTLMFTNAGMNQFKDVLTGKETRSYKRAASVQKCIRVSGKHNDFEIVGFDGNHHTFFEMLGNWSFGDYYKKEAIEFAWEFLTTILKLSENKLSVSIYKNDDESFNIWKNTIGLPENKIIRLGNIEKGDDENFWSMGEVGPCGPCTEIYYKVFNNNSYEYNENGYSDDYVELWNLVFMEFHRDSKGNYSPLKIKSVDTGMGFERLYSLLQKKESNYHTDLFMPIITHLEEITKKKYTGDNVSFQVIADHIRALTFSIGDGGNFSNEGRGYVLRKILRRAERHLKKLGITKPKLYLLVDDVVNTMGEFYTDLSDKKSQIQKFIKMEEEKFLSTLDTGLNQISIIIDKLKNENKTVIGGKDVFMLYDTYGFPKDITKEIARENNLEIDEAGYENYMEQQRKRGKASWGGANKNVNEEIIIQILQNIPNTNFTGYDTFENESKILGIIQNEKLLNELNNNEQAGIILDNTPFYAEMGGQIGDTGVIYSDKFKFIVKDTNKYGAYYVHWGELEKNIIHKNDICIAEVTSERRKSIMKNHTATHLLQAALKQVLGEHITQAGSYVGEDRLRFDFRHYESIKREDIKKIEQIINTVIQENKIVEKFTKEKEDAIKMGATAIFGEKYGEKVRVVKINDFSMELCGGTHIDRTGDIGLFVILSESSIAAGIRRIEAITGKAAIEHIQNLTDLMLDISHLLKTGEDKIPHRIKTLIKTNKELEKKLKEKKNISADDEINKLISNAKEINNSKLILKRYENEDMKFLNSLADRTKKKIESGIIFFANENNDKISLLLLLTDDIVKKGNSSVELINKISETVGGKGGGRPDRAQAGGKYIEKLDAMLNKADKLLTDSLS